jgi:hypothetical protein
MCSSKTSANVSCPPIGNGAASSADESSNAQKQALISRAVALTSVVASVYV